MLDKRDEDERLEYEPPAYAGDRVLYGIFLGGIFVAAVIAWLIVYAR